MMTNIIFPNKPSKGEMTRFVLDTIWKAVLSGIMIGFGGIVFLCTTDKIVGAFLFSFGLLTIVCRQLNLYTGKIGYIRNVGLIPILLIILGNFIGTFLMGTALSMADLPLAREVTYLSYESTLIGHFVRSMACGALMFLAVDSYAKSKSWIFVILPVVVFILCGFEHSIAIMFYNSYFGVWNFSAFSHLLLVILGNAVGSWIFKLQVK